MGLAIGFCRAVALMVLAGFAFAVSADEVRVVSNRIHLTDEFDWYGSGGAEVGPTWLSLPGFGELFVAHCHLAPEFAVPAVGLRNKSPGRIDIFGVGAVNVRGEVLAVLGLEAGAEVQLDIRASGPDQNGQMFQLGAGAGGHRRVATVVVSTARAEGACVVQGQAVIHQLK